MSEADHSMAERDTQPLPAVITFGLGQRIFGWFKSAGVLCATPTLIFFLIGFIGPLLIVGAFSFIPERTFGFEGDWTVSNYVYIITGSYYITFLWSFGLASVAVFCLFFGCYPIAYGLAKVFGKWAAPITLFVVLPLFVSENVRLFGWTLFLIKGGGILAGTMKTLFGLDPGTLLYTPGTILFGLVYVYLPFMLFPMVLGMAMVPKDLVDAARDLGASRWQIVREIEVPIAMPGIMIGGLLTFILSVGALSEANVLGGQNIVVIADDIRKEFTYAQNWPRGSALAMLVILLTGILVYFVMRRLDLDRLLGRK